MREHPEHFQVAEGLGVGYADALELWARGHTRERLEALRRSAPEVAEDEWCCFDHPDTFDGGTEAPA